MWNRFGPADQRHTVAVARRFVALRPATTPAQITGALLHDIGKLSAGLGTVGRVVATVVGPRTPRFRTYHDHEALGADALVSIGSNPVTISLVRGDGRARPRRHTALGGQHDRVADRLTRRQRGSRHMPRIMGPSSARAGLPLDLEAVALVEPDVAGIGRLEVRADAVCVAAGEDRREQSAAATATGRGDTEDEQVRVWAAVGCRSATRAPSGRTGGRARPGRVPPRTGRSGSGESASGRISTSGGAQIDAPSGPR